MRMNRPELTCMIPEVLLERGMTQTELAELTSLSDGYISLVARGVRYPSMATALMIARTLDASVEELWMPA